MGEAGGLLSLAGGLGGGGGKGGGGGGGLSPQQAALAEYTKEQQMLKARSTFANTGTGASTMATQAAGGANYAGAMAGAEMSNQNQQIANAQSGELATLAGQIAGSGDQSGGGSTSSTDTSSATGT
jgi:hypothetical protein